MTLNPNPPNTNPQAPQTNQQQKANPIRAAKRAQAPTQRADIWVPELQLWCTFGPELGSELKLWGTFGPKMGYELKLWGAFGPKLDSELKMWPQIWL